MKSIVYHFTFLAIIFISACQGKKESNGHYHDSTSTHTAAVDTIKKSIPKEAHAQIGNAHVMIKYHAPAVRGRTIWGGLVPYGEVWVTGAHSATIFEIDKDFAIGEREIPAGKYALFTIPRQDKWTVILNRNWDQHLADEYDEKEDVVRVDLSPVQNENIQERLTYAIIPDGNNKGVVSVSWEKIKISLSFQIK